MAPVTNSRRVAAGASLAGIAIAAALAALVWTTARGVAGTASGTWDETIYLFLGRELALSNNRAQLADLGVAPLPVAIGWGAGTIEPLAAPPHDVATYRSRIDRARSRAVIWFAIPLVVGLFATVAASRGLAVGFVAAAIAAMSPNLAAHYSLATTDAAFAAVFLACVLTLIAYVRRQTPARAILMAIVLGTALSTKYSAVGLYGSAALLFLVHRRSRRSAIDLAMFAASILIAWAAHGFAIAPLVAPGGGATQAVEALLAWSGYGEAIARSVTEWRGPIFIRGIAAQLYLDRAGQEAFLLGQTAQHGWWYYFPVALALKSTPIELCAFAAFIILGALRRFRETESAVIITVVSCFAAASLLSHRDLGVRYVLPVIVTALAAGIVWSGDALRERPRLALAAAVVALTMQFLSYRLVSPDYLAYFNGMSGGPAAGYTKLVDSNLDWGQDLIRLGDSLRAHGTNRVALAYFGSAPPMAYGVNAEPIRSAATTDSPEWLAVSATLLQGVFLCGDPFAPLRQLPFDDRAGYSIFMFDLRRESVRTAMAEVLRDPCVP
jgi:hypothetical protein